MLLKLSTKSPSHGLLEYVKNFRFATYTYLGFESESCQADRSDTLTFSFSPAAKIVDLPQKKKLIKKPILKFTSLKI